MREFADRGIAHAKKMVTKLAEAKTPCELYMVHGHYADAGEVAALMSSTLDVDMCMTGMASYHHCHGFLLLGYFLAAVVLLAGVCLTGVAETADLSLLPLSLLLRCFWPTLTALCTRWARLVCLRLCSDLQFSWSICWHLSHPASLEQSRCTKQG